MDTILSRGLPSVMAIAMLALGAPLLASNINGINGGMPNRISMNVTVPKQTQGATFGEKVNAGLHAAGSGRADGSSTIIIECGQQACAVGFPEGDGYRADFARLRVEVLKSNKAAALRKGEVGSGSALLGSALPGGAVISAAVSSVSSLAGGAGGGAAAASYARTAVVAEGGKEGLATAVRAPGVIDVLDPLDDGDYMLTLVVEKATSGLKDTLKTQVRTGTPQRMEITLVFTVQGGALKTRHDIALNAIRNMK